MAPPRPSPQVAGARSSGEPPPGSVLLGILGAPHGVRGELRLKSYTEDPAAIARYGVLTLETGEAVEIVSARPLKDDMLVVRLKGVGDRTAAERLTNRRLYASREALGAVEEDEFFHADLIGLAAETQDGTPFGTVLAVHDFGAGDLIEIRPTEAGPSLLLPFTRAVVPLVDIAGRRVVVDPPAETGDRGQET